MKGRTILLLDGPLQGKIHELMRDFPIPDRMALPDDQGERHWYAVDRKTQTARFLGRDERNAPMTDAPQAPNSELGTRNPELEPPLIAGGQGRSSSDLVLAATILGVAVLAGAVLFTWVCWNALSQSSVHSPQSSAAPQPLAIRVEPQAAQVYVEAPELQPPCIVNWMDAQDLPEPKVIVIEAQAAPPSPLPVYEQVRDEVRRQLADVPLACQEGAEGVPASTLSDAQLDTLLRRLRAREDAEFGRLLPEPEDRP
ncbi:MAG: hypothetical protein M5U26_08270 [Planctomycetota bacterium]|nr:hypothetical protein [Planctomycetota bacterium]